MTTTKKIELLKKLKALAERGVGGEAFNAEKMLNTLLKKHGLTVDDLEAEELTEYTFKFTTEYQRKLLMQLVLYVCGRDTKIFADNPTAFNKRKRGSITIKCTHASAMEIKQRFIIYYRLFEKELRTFYRAFLIANNLLLDADPNDNEAPTEQQIKEFMRSQKMSRDILAHTFLKQLK